MVWEERYRAEPDYRYGTEPSAILRENPWIHAGADSALCVADGEGRNSVHLARAGLDVTAFDLAPTAVARARALAEDAAVSVDHQLSDWEGWDWGQSYDLVAAIFIQWADPVFRARMFEDLRRVTRPGGRLLLHGYTPEQLSPGFGRGGPQDPDYLYTPELLQDAFGDWQVERLACYQRDLSEGPGHTGRAALIDLVARRPG